MRIFLDTNIITEFLFDRKYVEECSKIISSIENNENEGIISGGSFYTLTYLIDVNIKKSGAGNPARLEILRDVLKRILQTFNIAELSGADFLTGTQDKRFSDLEDSYQFQCAVKSLCGCIVTINKKDFPQNNTQIKILSPSEFLDLI